MNLVTAFTNDYSQLIDLTLEDGSIVNMSLTYVASQQGWFYSITYGSFSVLGMRLITGLNLLRKYRNIIPFGIRVDTSDGYEPVNINDFSSGRITFNLLSALDVQLTETYITQTLPISLGI